jgi:sec-independent protein translocase protein TatA
MNVGLVGASPTAAPLPSPRRTEKAQGGFHGRNAGVCIERPRNARYLAALSSHGSPASGSRVGDVGGEGLYYGKPARFAAAGRQEYWPMMGSLSIWHWLIIAVLAALVFGGGGKLSGLMGDAAKGIKAFRDGLKDETVPPSKPAEIPAPAPEPAREDAKT